MAALIFLDEVGEMTPADAGVDAEVSRRRRDPEVGADRRVATVDVRVIAATNRNLATMVTRGEFREDLFYRLKVIEVVVPPLRERRDDIIPLATHFIERFHRQDAGGAQTIGPDAAAALTAYAWPGNVRQLENVMERIAVTGRSETSASTIYRRKSAAPSAPARRASSVGAASPTTSTAG